MIILDFFRGELFERLETEEEAVIRFRERFKGGEDGFFEDGWPVGAEKIVPERGFLEDGEGFFGGVFEDAEGFFIFFFGEEGFPGF